MPGSLDAGFREAMRDVVEDAVRPVKEELERLRLDLVGRNGVADQDALLSTASAAELMGVTADTVREWIDQGRLIPHGTRRALRVSRRQLFALRPDQDGTEAVDLDRRAAEILDRPRGRG